MDPISASCYNLSSEYSIARQKTHEKYTQILGSTKSLSAYEEKNLKNLTPQIIAAILVTSYHVAIGISLAFSAILLPQLEENPEIAITENEGSWIASIIALTTPVGSLIVGYLMDNYGRLKTLAMASIPGVCGWIITALAQNVAMLIIGRALIGFATAIGSSPAIVYLTEIARKDMRGSLISLAPALTSLGMVLTFIMGWYMNWKQVAWFSNIIIIIPCILVFLIPESPAWLVSKSRFDEASKSLNWINKYQPQPANKNQTLAELQLALLQKEHEMKLIESSKNEVSTIRHFMKPTGYKPVLILIGLFFFQQFSGIFIFLFYSITFFQEIGCEFNPYFASIFIGIVRFIMSMVNTYTLKHFKRRPLVIISCLGMALCMFLSGIFTFWLQNGTTKASWVPIVFLLLFVVASMIGLIPIPYTMTAELFPLEIRGVAQSATTSIASVLMFVSLQVYPFLHGLCNGIIGIQIFFGVVTLLTTVYVYLFLPETHEKKLSEIEDYFLLKGWLY